MISVIEIEWRVISIGVIFRIWKINEVIKGVLLERRFRREFGWYF